jgi:hypothetical protein
MGRVSGFWSAVGLVIVGWIIFDVLNKPTGTAAAFNGVTGLTTVVGNQVTGAKNG